MSLITLSQDFASGGRAICNHVAKELNLTVYDDERLKEKALEIGIQQKNLPAIEEKSPGFFDRLLHKTPEIYLDILQGVVYSVAEQGDGIIFGHGSQILLKDFECALHIRVFAPKKRRVENAMKKRGVDLAHAEKIIQSKDQQLNGFFKYAFGKEYSDPSLYDLIINTDKISREQAAGLIIDLARSEEIKACSLTAMNTMRCLALEKKIHAKMLRANINPDMVFIKVPEIGRVALSGIANDEDEKKLIIKTVKDSEGVCQVEENLVLSHT